MNTNILGTLIRTRREKLGISIRSAAKSIGVSAAFMSDLELARRLPSDETLKSISAKLFLSVDELNSALLNQKKSALQEKINQIDIKLGDVK